jgi:hypothetical protein
MSDLRERRDFILAWFWHEGENLNQRTDWFLIFHAILVEAYLAAYTSSLKFKGLEIGVFGLVTSFIWLMIGVRQEWHIKFFTKCVRKEEITGSSEISSTLSYILDARDKQPLWMRWAHSVSLLSKLVPFCCVVMWAILVLQRCSLRWWWLLVAIIVSISGCLLMYARPKITSKLLDGFAKGCPSDKSSEDAML